MTEDQWRKIAADRGFPKGCRSSLAGDHADANAGAGTPKPQVAVSARHRSTLSGIDPMAWTQTDIDTLKKAMASGVLTFKHGETLLTFRTMSEMERVLARMESEVKGSRGAMFTEFHSGT
jgi:hypothetical protein